MKLLLTSNGICNQSLADAVTKMVGKSAIGVKVGFIPTAVNAEMLTNKDWFIQQLTDLQKYGFNWINIVELAAEDIDWRQKLDDVDVVYAGGGNPYYLLHIMRKVGFEDWLKANLDKKVYVGGSSGAIVLTPTVKVADIKSYGVINVPGITDFKGLNLIDFEIGPHIPDWPTYDEADKYAKSTKNKFYALDNESGVQVVDGEVKVISEGRWREYK